MNPRIVNTIFRKELLDTLRDKRTLIAMVGVPMVLYPVLIIAVSQFAIFQMTKLEETSSKVALIADDPALVREWIESIDLVELHDTEDPRADLQTGELDAVLVAQGEVSSTLSEGGTVSLKIEYDLTESASREAAERLREGLRENREKILEERLENRGLDLSFANPIKIEEENVATPTKTTGSLLGAILPIMIVVMLGVGAFYPAIDLTAGEKERGTFETLLSSPTTKSEIVAGKFMAVFVLCMTTGLLNLGSLAATVLFQFSQLIDRANGDGEAPDFLISALPPYAFLSMLVIMIPLAFFISAVMMTVSVLARNFKEAQNFVTPFFIAIIVPASMSVIPDIELNRATLFVPIGNATLLFRDLMTGEASLESIFVVFVCTAVYAALALVVAAWIFQREEVILSEERGLPLTFHRADFHPSAAPDPGAAFALLTIVMLLIFYVGTYVQAKDILIGLLISEYLVILTPVLLFLWFARINMRRTLNLRLPSPGAALGTLLIAPAWLVIAVQIGIWNEQILPLPEEFLEGFEELFAVGDTTGGLIFLLFVVALSPAICEEALFRGTILSGLRGRIPPWAVVLVIGIAFGLFHLSIYRFIGTGATGLVLTYLALRSGSILPACFVHFLVNASAVLVETGKAPARILQFAKDENLSNNGLPAWLLGLALLVFVVGVIIVEKFSRGRREADQ